MNKVRVGIIGVGNMGSAHARWLLEGKVARGELVALCDTDAGKLASFKQVQPFHRSAKMLRSGTVDAVIIATPHYDHTTIGIDALKAGLHVLVEKPVSVHKADAERLIAAHTKPGQEFAAMFNQRTDPYYRKIREMIQKGDLGDIKRVVWIITNWFRTEAYYASGGWRATWAGEGGGVLLNQCPHNLDLLQWLCGMPARVRAACHLGKYHNIEVEDDVTAYLEYPGGATGVFITTTGEAPGTNRLEITAERGKLVYENDVLAFTRNEVPMTEFSRTSDKPFAAPAASREEFRFDGHGGQHVEILQNFVDAILDGKPLVAPAEEGIHSVELANAMLLSSWTGKPAELPLNAAAYARKLRERIATSRFKKPTIKSTAADLAGSWR